MIRKLAVVIALGGALLAPTSASAGDERGSSDLELALIDQEFAVDANGRWRATFSLEGDTEQLAAATPTTSTTTTAAPPSTSETSSDSTDESDSSSADEHVRIVVYLPIDDRRELTEFIDGDDRNAIDLLDEPLASALDTAGGTTQLRVDARTTTQQTVQGALHLRRPGLYPLAVQVLGDGNVLAEHRTFIERLPIEPTGEPPIAIAVLATIPEPTPTAADELTDDQRAELEALVELAEGFAAPLTVALPPTTLRGVAAEAPGLEAELRAALGDAELLALPSAPLDPSSAVAIGQADTFTRQLVEGEGVIKGFSPSSAAARSAWISTGAPLSRGAAAMVRNLGFDLVVFDQPVYDDLEGSIGGYFDTTQTVQLDLGDDDSMPALVLSPLGELLDPGRPQADDPVDAAIRILAELLTTRRELGEDRGRGVVLTAPDGRLPDVDVAAALAELAAGLDAVRLVPVSALRSTDAMLVDDRPSIVSLPSRAGPDLAARLERIERTRVATESAASMQLDDTDATRWQAQLDALVTTALTDDQVDAQLGRIAAEADAVLASVEAPDPFDFTLTGRSSTLRLNVRNNADEALRVIIRPSSPKLTFPNGPQPVELLPSGFTEVEIPVEARSNDTSSIEIELLTPALEQQINGTVVLTAHVNALTGLSQVITVGALLVLVSWWFSHFRRQRRERSLAVASAASAAALDDVSPDAAEAAGSGLRFDDDLDLDLDPASDSVRHL